MGGIKFQDFFLLKKTPASTGQQDEKAPPSLVIPPMISHFIKYDYGCHQIWAAIMMISKRVCKVSKQTRKKIIRR